MFHPQTKRLGILLFVLVIALTAAVVGCGSSGSTTTTATPTTVAETTTVPSSTDTTAAQGGGPYTIGLSLASATNPFYVGMQKGIEAKAAELGVTVRVVVANEDQSLQVNGVQDLVTQQVDAILISPISVEGSIAAYEAAKSAGIPIISLARTIKNPDLEATYVGMDIVQDGRNTGEWIATKLGGKGTVAMLKGPAGASFAMDLEKGVKEALAKYPDIKIVAEVNSPLTKEDGLKNTENILTANPDLGAIYCANDEIALGAVQAAESAGRLDKLAITGYNGVPPAIESIKAGKLAMTTALKAGSWGALALQTAVDILNGKSVGAQVANETKIVDQANVASLTAADLN